MCTRACRHADYSFKCCSVLHAQLGSMQKLDWCNKGLQAQQHEVAVSAITC